VLKPDYVQQCVKTVYPDYKKIEKLNLSEKVIDEFGKIK
jgi:hypothetical protein